MNNIKPEVGMGCTECVGTDRNACTITKVSESGKTIWYRWDNAKVVKGDKYNGTAEYEYSFDENGTDYRARLRKDGRYIGIGTDNRIILGVRDEYYDPHF